MTAVKVIKVMGTSGESWEAAAEEALGKAGETVEDISGLEIESWTAEVENGEITEYRATTEIAFPVREE